MAAGDLITGWTGNQPVIPETWNPSYNQLQGQYAGAGASMYGANKQLQAAQVAADAQRYSAGLQAQAAMYPATLAMQRFNEVFPFISGQLRGRSPFSVPTPNLGAQPHIGTGAVFSPGDIQQQVNATRAANDQAAQAQMRTSGQQLAGRGLGGTSPLAQALNTATWGQNLATNTQAEQQARFNAAELNTKYGLQAQGLQEQQYASRQEEYIKRQQIGAQTYSALLAALSGLA